MSAPPALDPGLARRLVLDELFDLSLYRALRGVASGRLREILEELIPVEARHFAFWQEFTGMRISRLDWTRQLKLRLVIAACRLLGAPAIHLALEAIEVYGVRKYLAVWKAHGDGPLGAAVRQVLEDEFEHEDTLVTGDADPRLRPDRVRNIFLGLNDGLIEILGAVSGFFAAFGDALTVLAAGSTVAVAGALSMAAGAFVAASSEAELRATESERRRFLGRSADADSSRESPLVAALVVGASYLAGALAPVLPLVLGARSVWPSVLVAAILIVAVSSLLAFLSGMSLRRRTAVNLAIIAAAVLVSHGIGLALRHWTGIDLG